MTLYIYLRDHNCTYIHEKQKRRSANIGSYFASLLPSSLIHGIVLINPVSANLSAFKKFKIPIIVHLDVQTNETERIEVWSAVTGYP